MLVLILILPPGVDYRGLGRKDMSQAVSYLGQDPMMFSGTLRENLNPEDTLPDADIWRAVRSCHCSEFVESLDNNVADRGGNYSIGVRQLFCLTRTVLQRRKVL